MTTKEAYRILRNPKLKWTTGKYSNGHGARCAIGHLSKAKDVEPENAGTTEVGRFIYRAEEFIHGSIINVNDTPNVNGYTESNPRERVLHLLRDMMKAERKTKAKKKPKAALPTK